MKITLSVEKVDDIMNGRYFYELDKSIKRRRYGVDQKRKSAFFST